MNTRHSPFFVTLHLESANGNLSLNRLLFLLLKHIGSYIKVVLAFMKDDTSILILALQGTHLGASALQSHLYSAFRREIITYVINILVQPRRSLNTLCAELFILAEPQVITWGLALQEVHARALASQQKVRLELALKLLVRVNPHLFHPLSPSKPEEYPANQPQHQDTRSALARLSHFVRIHAFPKPYSRNDLGI